MLFNFSCSSDFIKLLEVKNFVFFVRAKYIDAFIRHKFLNIVLSSDIFENYEASLDKNGIKLF
ncbi:hypothetical protein H312_02428 [Anncaliia algerae PRA339]|uniref:Uncharacterized protein n=1 Tax=Anncaliia algerae PRA339 TaxID=1288291 RepID=A0A059EZ96_9MICR|nr:hypothetical protein H312_02428 [Anncaliia algerae PRA339]